jgi:hypothetical protein
MSESPGKVVCTCCELDVPERLSSEVLNAHSLVRGWRCRMCNDHQGDKLKKALDHETEVRMRWDETVDLWHSAEDRADDYREKMLAALRSRDSLIKQFEQLRRYHRTTGDGCLCGKPKCETLRIVDGDYITERIAAMHKREKTGH